MILGILVNSDRHRDDVIGLVKAAKEAGHQVKLFAMDDGTLVTDDICKAVGDDAEVAYCDHSAEARGVKDVEGATSGSQYQNAVMVHDSDKVVVF
jgi:sulfur relay (sulfurtransferase) complex TusBCD TusD component (DsrE family)